jgi:LmbE family N-acetylglucosaminyl deacetylase
MEMKPAGIILSVTAHPDDEVLGFGATAARLAASGCEVHNCILSGEVDVRRHRPEIEELRHDIDRAQEILGCRPAILGAFPNIAFNTVPHIELVRFIEAAIEAVRPDYIFTHHPNDLNNDHHHVSIACQAASRLYQRKPVKRIRGLYLMEIPSSTDWAYSVGANRFQPNTYFEVGEEYLSVKLKALEAYRGVMRPFPHSRSGEVLRGLSACRGAEAGMRYAEAFQALFQTLNIA